MRLLLIILIVSSFSAAFAYDLQLSVNSPAVFNLSQSNSYSVVVKNLNGTAPNYINFTVDYWINSSSGFVSGYPKNYSDSLKSQSTSPAKYWTPDEIGNFTVCGNITSSTANDTNTGNDFACQNVLVNGSSQSN